MTWRELSLFSGYCGFTLGLRLARLDVRTVGYVDNEPYIQKLIAQRIKDGFLDEAPIFGDVKRFLSDGYAASYRGVDIITAGFPCQPHSSAGRRLGASDPRNLWPELAECIGAIRPRIVLLENVPGIVWNTQRARRLHGGVDRRRRDDQHLVIIKQAGENIRSDGPDRNERKGETDLGIRESLLWRAATQVSGADFCMECWMDTLTLWATSEAATCSYPPVFEIEARTSYARPPIVLPRGGVADAQGKHPSLVRRGKGICGCTCHDDDGTEQEGADANLWDDSRSSDVGLREPLDYGAERLVGFAATVHGSLARIGYDARWGLVPASAVGAPHLRWRWWCLAYPADDGRRAWGRAAEQAGEHDALGRRELAGPDGEAGLVADATSTVSERQGASRARGGGLADAGWWDAEPALDRVVDGYSGRVDELRAIGNGIVPACVALFLKRISGVA